MSKNKLAVLQLCGLHPLLFRVLVLVLHWEIFSW
jgi:hypothetical protein